MNQKNINCNSEDLDLINKVKLCCDNLALKELEIKHSGICHQMIKKYYQSFVNSGIDPEEVVSDKLFVIYKSALNFDPDKNVKFSTWVGNQMRYYCLNCLNKKRIKSVSMDNEILKNIIEKNQSNAIQTANLYKEKSEIAFSLLDKLKDKRIIKIFKLRYLNTNNKKRSWSDIGKKMKLSTQTVINLHNKGSKILKNKLTSINNIDII